MARASGTPFNVPRSAPIGGLVFTGDAEENFIALNAATGKPLWHFQMGEAVYASPMAFAVDGKEYIAVAAGSSPFWSPLNPVVT